MAFLQEQAGGETGEKALAAIHSQEAVEGLRRFYLQGVRDLDAKFSAWWSQMGQLKGASNRYLVFTSDHGEAFYEHGNSSHHGSMWEEVLRIPLIIVGPGVQPRRESFAASLVDFPRTLASIAGIPKADEWQGTNLLSLDADRPVYGFYKAPNQYELVVIDGLRKLFWDAEHSDRPPARAYDLGRDPGERTDVATDSSWPQDLADKHLREIQRLMQSATPGTRLGAGALSEEALENLRAIGYAGD
jgi:arylsulfatase A-like enzyme